MNYYISEGSTTGKYNASSKAREDADFIFNRFLYNIYNVETIRADHSNKYRKLYRMRIYLKNYYIFKKAIKKFKKNDTVIFQYPLKYPVLFFDKIIKKINKKGVKTIVLIHDLDSLRFLNMPRIKIEDATVLKQFSKVISHNEKMTEYLLELGVKKHDVINLEIFDYIIDEKIKKCEVKKGNEVIIAGNLSPEKAKYISKLNKIKNVNFGLYGIGYEPQEKDKNITYNGVFKPDELVSNLNGKFGLIWDGESTGSCDGIYGEYLKYNNPHKTSLYLVSNIPVIVWAKSAMAKFVIENNLGIVVDNLNELRIKMDGVNEEEYAKMLKNVEKISLKLKRGKFLTEALKHIQKEE